MDLIGQEHSELSVLELEKKKKNAIFDFVYTIASANIGQSSSNLVTINDHRISHNFDYGSNRTRITRVIRP